MTAITRLNLTSRPALEETGVEWVFGYGSLIWRPGFAYLERRPARLEGYHRDFCVTSHFYRGTPEAPGLVLGLAPGGACEGMAYRIAAGNRPETLRYLDERELTGYAYIPVIADMTIEGQRLAAFTYIADAGHGDHAGDLDRETRAERIAVASGDSGGNLDYLENILFHLDSMEMDEPALHDLHARVKRLTALGN